jgi:RNA polymerase sigma-32 factor
VTAADILTREEEQALARRWREHADLAARDRLVLAHLPLGRLLARRCKAHGVATDDLEQQAVLGLIRSADGFDPERGLRFGTFARWWVRTFLDDYVVRNARVVRPPLGKGRGKRLNEIRMVSFDQPAGGEEQSPLADMIPDEAPLPDEGATIAIDGETTSERLAAALAALDRRSRAVVEGRFLEGALLRVVGERLGISKERVRQIESAALKRLRQLMTAPEDAA